MKSPVCAVAWCVSFVRPESQYCSVHARDQQWRATEVEPTVRQNPTKGALERRRFDPCDACDGTGDGKCEVCDGAGSHECADYRCHAEHDCGACDGVGVITCESCDGEKGVEWWVPVDSIDEQPATSIATETSLFSGESFHGD